MKNINETIQKIKQIIVEIRETATDVNKASLNRKEITESSLSLIQKIINKNSDLRKNFNNVYQSLNNSLQGIETNSEQFKENVRYFNNIIKSIQKVRQILNNLESEIVRLTKIVDVIKNDTDEIFTLALNASIVSSKYTHTSGVFDIIANKLNEMSNFINQNLENIVQVVKPITNGIHNLINENEKVLKDIENGYNNFIEFSTAIDEQKISINKLTKEADSSALKIVDQRKMLDEINNQVVLMDQDANGAIEGSDTVRKISENLDNKIDEVEKDVDSNANIINGIHYIEEQIISVWQSAHNVNEKSRSQLEFSVNAVDFADNIISEAKELRGITENFNNLSLKSNTMAGQISKRLGELTGQLNEIERKIGASNNTIQIFNEDYMQIDNILEFLKNILKSMNIIGMYSRIESARDPEEFQGFMTISENIIKLQNEIHNNIPLIEENIEKTHEFIEEVNNSFKNISSVFYSISHSSSSIIDQLQEIIKLTLDSERYSTSTLEDAKQLDELLKALRDYLLELTEIVKKPIDGSASNIDRGKEVEQMCKEIKAMMQE